MHSDRPATARPPDPVAALRSLFGYPGFRPGQEELVRAVLAGRDALGVLPTGGGKSVCFQLPAAILSGITLVVSPLVSLMADQEARALELGIEAASWTSATPRDRARSIVERARAGRLRLLLVSPERLRIPAFQAELSRWTLGLIAVDEAHCISEWGHDFRPDYRTIGRLRGIPGIDAPVLALTASATPAVRDDISRSLGLRSPIGVVGSFDRPNLAWRVRVVRGHARKRAAALEEVRRALGTGSIVLYAATRRAVESLRDHLAARGVSARAYHAGLEARTRARVQDDFMKGRVPVIVATNAFGMGIDQPGVRLVVHYQLPGTLESYYQESGRAGRDGAPARCVALFDPADAEVHRAFLDRSRPPVRVLRRVYRALREETAGRESVRTVSTPEGLDEEPPFPEENLVAVHPDRLGEGRRRLPRETVEGALRALVGAGGVTLRTGPAAADGSVPEVEIGLTCRKPDWRVARRLRRAGKARIRAVRRFARSRECRRNGILRYFGESPDGRCGRCDRCTPG